MILAVTNLRINLISTPLHHRSFATHNLRLECTHITQRVPTITRVMDEMYKHLFRAFALYTKLFLLDNCKVECTIKNCYTCLKYK